MVRVAMPPRLQVSQRKKLEATARTCPVKQSLSPEIVVEVFFAYPD